MAVPEGKTRLQITVSDELLGNVDEYAKQTGLSRSAIFASCTAEKLAALSGMTNGVLELAEKLMREQTEQKAADSEN